MKPYDLTIIVVSMNRSDHLAQTLKHNSTLDHVKRITLLDFGSNPLVKISDISVGCPVFHVRVNHNNKWTLSRAYNIAISLTDCDYFVKTDADMYIGQDLIDFALSNLSNSNFITGNPFSGSGPLIVSKQAIEAAGYFNEDLIGWGYEEIDLYSRIRRLGLLQRLVPKSSFLYIDHGDERRTTFASSSPKELTNLSNCIVSMLNSGLTTRDRVLSLLKSREMLGTTAVFDDLWSDQIPTAISIRIVKRLSDEFSGAVPPLLYPLALDLISIERNIYASMANQFECDP